MKNVFFILGCFFSGDICQQFTREMFDMYQGFASYKNWDFDLINYTNAEYGRHLLVYPCSFMTTYVGFGLRWSASRISSNHR